MVFYVLSFFSIFYAKKMNSIKKILVFLWLFSFSVFFAFRSVGLDLEPYRELFNSFDSNSFLISGSLLYGRIELAFILLISFLKSHGLGFEFFLLISGLIPTLVIIRTLQLNMKENFLVSFSFFIFVYFLKGPADVIRAFASASLYLYALSSLAQGRNFAFFFKSLIAISLHYSALIAFLIYPFKKFKWDLTSYLTVSMVLMLIGFGLSNLINSVDLSEEYSSLHPIIFKLIYYLTYYNKVGYQYLNDAHFVFYWLKSLSFPLLVIFNTLHILLLPRSNWSKFKILIFKSQVLGTLIFLFLVALGAYTFGERVLFLLAIGCFILIAEVVTTSGKPNRHLIIYFWLIFANIFISLAYLAGFFDPKSPFNLFG
jgi:hypothetical protein